jgi:ketosteroid isomerase-like protein
MWRARRAGLAVVLLVAACRTGRETERAGDALALRGAVDELLDASEIAWNAGDLDRFMGWYERGAETSFMTNGGPIHGWDAIRERYAPRFAPGASRDSLRFENLETRPLALGLGLATARYVLFAGDSTVAAGIFTLVVKETQEGWRIIHDHSSATPNP